MSFSISIYRNRTEKKFVSNFVVGKSFCNITDNEVIWTAQADKDIFNIATYLLENWSENSAKKFLDNVMRKIENLSQMSTLGRPTTKEGYLCITLIERTFSFLKLMIII